MSSIFSRYSFPQVAFLLALSAGAVSAAGLASSSAPFEVLRGGGEKLTLSNAVLNAGDIVQGEQAAVQVEFPNGNSMLVDKGSRAAVGEEGTIELKKGALIAGRRGDDLLSVVYSDLKVDHIGGEESGGTVYVGESPEGGLLQVASFDGRFAVTDSRTAEGVSMLSPGETIHLRRVEEQWVLVQQASLPAAAQPGATDLQSGALNENVERIVPIWWVGSTPLIIGGGALGAAGATFLIIDAQDDDDSSPKEPSRQPFSPISSSSAN